AHARGLPAQPEAQGGAAAGLLGAGHARFTLYRDPVAGARSDVTGPEGLVGEYAGRYWQLLPDGRMQCDLCPRDCKLHDGQRGACFVRMRSGDRMLLTTYGRSSGFCVDPIEKKPLN